MATSASDARHCCVPQCTSDGRYDPSLSFHSIPTDTQMRKQWIVKIRRDEGPFFKISKATVVCSKHFKQDDFKWTPVRKTLKRGAVPTVFNWVVDGTPRRTIERKVLAPSRTKVTDRTSASDETTGMECEDPDGSTDETVMSTEDSDVYNENTKLKEQLNSKTEECENIKMQLEIERFGIQRFSEDNNLINFYTGFPSYTSFQAFFTCIQPTAQTMQSAYYRSSETVNLCDRKRSMLLIDELFMFLCRLRCGLLEQDLSVRFNCSLASVSRKIVTWANFLYFTLGSIPIWLPRTEIQRLMPDEFKTLYPNTRVVIDCTEIYIQKPSSLVFNSQSFSSYKGSNTFKCLLGVAPHGVITFISSLYTRCMSDVEITKLSGLLDLLEPGDDVMADKGFTIKSALDERGWTLNIPHFLSSKRQFSVDEVQDIERIARLRIHIERMNRRIKENHLFDTPIPINLCGSINQMWVVACMLALFKGPLVESWGAT